MDGNENITNFTSVNHFLSIPHALCKGYYPIQLGKQLSFIMCAIALASQTVFIFLLFTTTGHVEKRFMTRADIVQHDSRIDRVG